MPALACAVGGPGPCRIACFAEAGPWLRFAGVPPLTGSLVERIVVLSFVLSLPPKTRLWVIIGPKPFPGDASPHTSAAVGRTLRPPALKVDARRKLKELHHRTWLGFGIGASGAIGLARIGIGSRSWIGEESGTPQDRAQTFAIFLVLRVAELAGGICLGPAKAAVAQRPAQEVRSHVDLSHFGSRPYAGLVRLRSHLAAWATGIKYWKQHFAEAIGIRYLELGWLAELTLRGTQAGFVCLRTGPEHVAVATCSAMQGAALKRSSRSTRSVALGGNTYA